MVENLSEQRHHGIPLAVLLVVGMVLLFAPLAVLGVWDAVAIAKRERADVERAATRIVIDSRYTIDNALTHYVAILQTLAESPAIDSGNFRELYGQAQAVLRPLGLYVLLRDRTGQQLFNTRVEFGTALPREKGFDDPVFETRQAYASDLIIGAVAKQPVIGLSVPVNRAGELLYVLTMSIDPSHFAKMLYKADLPRGWIINLVDRQGVRIARSDESSEFVGVPMPGDWRSAPIDLVRQSIDAEGQPVLTAVLQSARYDWYVAVSAPELVIADQVKSALLRYMAGATALALFALLGAYLLGRYIVMSLRRLADAARNLGAQRPVTHRPSFIREADTVGRALKSAGEQRDRHEDEIRVLMGEVNHRAKNMLTVIQTMARRSRAKDVDAFRDLMVNRLAGLAASQDVLVANSWRAADLRELVASHLALFADPSTGAIKALGPDLRISTTAAQAIGMALHELGTNSTKYGALGSEGGTVAVAWRVSRDDDDGPQFRMSWSERGGPPAAAPTETGFGHTIIVQAVENSLQGSVELTFGPLGLDWNVSAPLSAVVTEEHAAGSRKIS